MEARRTRRNPGRNSWQSRMNTDRESWSDDSAAVVSGFIDVRWWFRSLFFSVCSVAWFRQRRVRVYTHAIARRGSRVGASTHPT